MKRYIIPTVLSLICLLVRTSYALQEQPASASPTPSKAEKQQATYQAKPLEDGFVIIGSVHGFGDDHKKVIKALQAAKIEIGPMPYGHGICGIYVLVKDRPNALRILEEDARKKGYWISLDSPSGKGVEINRDKSGGHISVVVATISKKGKSPEKIGDKVMSALSAEGMPVSGGGSEWGISVPLAAREIALRVLQKESRKYPGWIHLKEPTQPYKAISLAYVYKDHLPSDDMTYKFAKALIDANLEVGLGSSEDGTKVTIEGLEHQREKAAQVLRKESLRYPGWLHFVDDARKAPSSPVEKPNLTRQKHDGLLI